MRIKVEKTENLDIHLEDATFRLLWAIYYG